MRRIFQGASTLVCALIAALVFAGSAAADPPMWRIKGANGAEVVMFGSVHVLNESLDWRRPEMLAALASATDLWFEVPVTPSARSEGAAAAVRRGQLPRAQRLNDLLTIAQRAQLSRIADRLMLSMEQVQQMTPWFAEAVISLADLQRRGARQADGVEEQLSAAAPAGATRHAFETPTQQIAILADQPLSEQVASLAQTLDQLEEEPQSFAELQAAWVAGDTQWIEREALDPMRLSTPRLYQGLVVDRNRRWTAVIERLLGGQGRIFIVVGAGHLVGPDSVPAMLRRHGFTVEGP